MNIKTFNLIIQAITSVVALLLLIDPWLFQKGKRV